MAAPSVTCVGVIVDVVIVVVVGVTLSAEGFATGVDVKTGDRTDAAPRYGAAVDTDWRGEYVTPAAAATSANKRRPVEDENSGTLLIRLVLAATVIKVDETVVNDFVVIR